MRNTRAPKYVMYHRWGLATKGSLRERTQHKDEKESFRSRPNNQPSKIKLKTPTEQVQVKKYELNKRSQLATAGQALDESQAVRRKIEEFRRWHEEHYRQRIAVLKARVEETSGTEKGDGALVLRHLYGEKVACTENKEEIKGETAQVEEVSYVKIGAKSANHGKTGAEITVDIPTATAKSLPQLANGAVVHTNRHDQSSSDIDSMSCDSATVRPDSPPAVVPAELKHRIHSAKTWHTWRDMNQSDAYSDVESYIKDNDLLEGDKSKHISDWVADVETARSSGLCIGIDGETISVDKRCSSYASSATFDLAHDSCSVSDIH